MNCDAINIDMHVLFTFNKEKCKKIGFLANYMSLNIGISFGNSTNRIFIFAHDGQEMRESRIQRKVETILVINILPLCCEK